MMHLMNRCLYRNLSLLWCSGLRGWKKSGAGLSLGFWRNLQLAGLMWVIWGGLMVSGCQSPSVGSLPLEGYRMSVQAVINGNTLEAIGVEAAGVVAGAAAFAASAERSRAAFCSIWR